MTRVEATRAHTALALAWLWHARGHRALSVEVGADVAHLRRPLEGSWRADAVGVTVAVVRRRGAGLVEHRVDLVEVKGTRADLVRERFDTGKWPEGMAEVPCWLLVSADCRDSDLDALPAPWGLLRADADARSVRVVRKPAAPQRDLDEHELYAVACTSLSACLPAMHSVPGMPRPKLADRIALASQRIAGILP